MRAHGRRRDNIALHGALKVAKMQEEWARARADADAKNCPAEAPNGGDQSNNGREKQKSG